MKFIKQIQVLNLYGFLNHTITLKDDGITIIHGPNGSGKTRTLEIINNFFDEKFNILSRYDFEFLKITFTENDVDSEIIIKRQLFDLKNNEYPTKELTHQEHIKFHSNNESFSRLTLIKNDNIYLIGSYPTKESKIKYFEDEKGEIRIKIPSHIRDNFFMEDFESNLTLYNKKIFIQAEKKSYKKIDQHDFDDLKKLINSIKVFMIKTQRLINLPEISSTDDKFSNYMIENYAKDLANKIGQPLKQSNEKTATHGFSFPERLIKTINSGEPKENEDSLRLRYKNTEEKIKRISEAGLIFGEKNIALPDTGLNQEDIRTVLSLYLDDLNDKLSLYDELLSKIETFKEIISNKIKNKVINIDPEKGFSFTSKYVSSNLLNLNQLSSGEQHEIVLFYELIFLAESGTYYLIDEPEISLHVDWQRSFLDDIAKVAKLRSHKFIVATHSPQIIGNRRSLCVALDGGIL